MDLKEALVEFLKENSYVFAWSDEDMQGVYPKFIVYKLNMDPNFQPIRQKKRSFNPESYGAISVEVEKFLKARLIK